MATAGPEDLKKLINNPTSEALNVNSLSMTRIFRLIFFIFLLSSCSESFKTLDQKAFNQQIAGRTDIKTPEELIKLYFNWPPNEGTPQVSVETENLGDNKFKITLIHSHMDDDSEAAEKIVMTAHLTGLIWTVDELKMNWKCWDDRGHTSWGTGACS